MVFADLHDPRFTDVDEARKWFESQRWPDGMICPHCRNFDQTKIKALRGRSHRRGLYECAQCRLQFTVTVGTSMHRSKIPLNKWLIAMHLIAASEKGVRARELHHALGIAYHSAWYLSWRIRNAMDSTEPVTAIRESAGGPQDSQEEITRLLMRTL